MEDKQYFNENTRLNINQLTKLFFDPNMEYSAIIIDDKLCAVSAYRNESFENKNIIFLNEVMGFKKRMW